VTPPPCYTQWESRDLVGGIIAGAVDPREDPRWRESGARDAEDYARWADHVCGMACLRMLLGWRGITPPPTLDLARRIAARGGYVETPEGGIRGLIYAPAVEYLREAHGIAARVVLDVTAADVAGMLAPGAAFIASVHPWIRRPEAEPPLRGGHLVLVFGVAADGALRFHNPSGDRAETQEDVRLPPATFDRFFAGRGILVA
jgi:hypothetical protein